MAQNFFSKNFDISSVSSTIPMNYTGYGPKLSIGYSRESYYRGWMIGGGLPVFLENSQSKPQGKQMWIILLRERIFISWMGSLLIIFAHMGEE